MLVDVGMCESLHVWICHAGHGINMCVSVTIQYVNKSDILYGVCVHIYIVHYIILYIYIFCMGKNV